MASLLKKVLKLPRIRQTVGCYRYYAEEKTAEKAKKGVVMGVFEDPETHENKLTKTALKYNQEYGGKLEELVKKQHFKLGDVQVYNKLDPDHCMIAVVGVGPEDVGYNPLDVLDECRENIRVSIAEGIRHLQELRVGNILIDDCGNAEAAAESAGLTVWRYQQLKNDHKTIIPSVSLYNESDMEAWEIGQFKAEAQNLARFISEHHGGHTTCSSIAQLFIDALCQCDVDVDVRDKDWIIEEQMKQFLHTSKSSVNEPVFVEIQYCGAESRTDLPVMIVGKGVLFDSGGLNLKKVKALQDYHMDMAGAGVVVAVIRAAAALQLPINLVGLIPICENTTSGMAMRPGDIVYTRQGRSILIEKPDHPGRLLMADALEYGIKKHHPKLTITVGSMTRGMVDALGSGAPGCYTLNHDLWDHISRAGAITGDRVWRFPVWKYFTRKIKEVNAADLTNDGRGPGGGPCKCAAFINEFVPCGDWMHIDLASCGLRATHRDYPYLTPGWMTGRPTRTIIQFLYQLTCDVPLMQ